MSNVEMVNLTIDGKKVTVPKGTNLIEAARAAGIAVPYYCYHPHLSVAGNCRMCQVQVTGQPKLTIGCNTGAAEGMDVHTHLTSKDVSEAQRATLEFLLINHPLDCTVCDQAGHCKLQDYYYDYNRQASRFIEEKEQKVKAEVLGPEIVYDGERCITCTRCTRFCDEVVGTSELGVFNRGDKSVIGVYPGKELNNPFSGTVADLCPVGALTHRRWRFNSRIWYTSQVDTICTGCSSGCNVRAAVRDGEIVHVKARMNSFVNKEWLCDEGRYGFPRFQATERLSAPVVRRNGRLETVSIEEGLKVASGIFGSGDSAVLLSPFLTLEEVWTALTFAQKLLGLAPSSGRIGMQIRQRELTETESILICPDYAPNSVSALVAGLVQATETNWRGAVQQQYEKVLADIRAGAVKKALFVGDFSVLATALDEPLREAIKKLELSVGLTPSAVEGTLFELCSVVLPSRTVHEKNGVMINASGRFQKLRALLNPPFGTQPEWMWLNRIAQAAKKQLLPADVIDERALFRLMTSAVPVFAGLTLAKIGELGITLSDLKAQDQAAQSGAPAQG